MDVYQIESSFAKLPVLIPGGRALYVWRRPGAQPSPLPADRIAYSVPEAARATGYSETRIRRSIRKGDLKAGRPSGRGDYRIFTEVLK